MEGGSTNNSRRKSYKAKFKLEVVEVAKEKGNREAEVLCLIMQRNGQNKQASIESYV